MEKPGWQRISYTGLKPSEIVNYINEGWRFNNQTGNPKQGLYMPVGGPNIGPPTEGSPEKQLVDKLIEQHRDQIEEDVLNKM